MNYTFIVIVLALTIIQATNLFFPTEYQLYIALVLFVVWSMMLSFILK